MSIHVDTAVERIDVAAYRVPTDEPESDGTFRWDSTTIVVVEAHAGDRVGLGYTYGSPACGLLVQDTLAPLVEGLDAHAVPAAWKRTLAALRNIGLPGVGALAVSALDAALWDLHARLLDIALVDVLGSARDAVPIYGSGGFTSYTVERLQSQFAGWVDDGIPRVKMKIGRDPCEDRVRVRAARAAIGDAALFVDANGAYSVKQALGQAAAFAEQGVTWFEEPVSSDDLVGLRQVREQGPAAMDVAAGEYGFDPWYFRRMLEAEAVDCLQADATRCLGITGFRIAADAAMAFERPFSGHCAPSIHAHPACSVPAIRHLEYFHDHARLEPLLFDGVLEPVGGALVPDRSRPGNGLTLKRADAAAYAI